MTPAIKILQSKKIKHLVQEYSHDTSTPSYGLEAAEKLQLAPESVFKTLVVMNEKKELYVAMVPVSHQLNLKNMAKAIQSKKVTMAPATDVERSTGYILGGVSPLGQKKRLTTIIDESALTLDKINVSAGRRGLEVQLAPSDLIQILGAKAYSIASHSI